MTEYELKAEIREEHGKAASRRFRREGKIPAVIYGAGQSEKILIDQRELKRLVSAGATGKLVSLVTKSGRTNQKQKALLKEVQLEPIKGMAIHADFQKVDMAHAITTRIAVHFVGEEKRPSDGAVIQHLLREIEIHCLPDRIPEVIEVDISGLKEGHSIFVKDLSIPAGVTVTTPGEEVLALATVPHQAPAAAEGEAAEADKTPEGE